MKAIDTHVHPGTKEDVIDCGGKYIEDAYRYFGKKSKCWPMRPWRSAFNPSTSWAFSSAGMRKRTPA